MLMLTQLDQVPNAPLTLRPTLSMTLFSSLVNYQVIVEMWDKRTQGRVKREWLKTFDEQEREVIGRYYPIFYNWYLVKGAPDQVMLQLKTLNLLQRAANFFGTV